MVATTVKSTYSLDPETVHSLNRLARRLGISKSEVLRRAIRQLCDSNLPPESSKKESLDELQRRVMAESVDAEEWAAELRRERLASSRL